MIKKSLCALLCALLAAGLAGCAEKTPPPSSDSQAPSSSSQPAPESEAPAASTATPSGTVALLMESIRAWDTEEMGKYLTSPKENGSLIGGDLETAENVVGMDLVKEFCASIQYGIKGEEIQGDTATVQLSVTVPDLSGMVGELAAKAATQAALKAIKGEDFDAEAFVLDYIRSNADLSGLSLIQTDTPVHLLRQADGSWLADNDSQVNFGLGNALSGGIAEKYKGLADELE